MKFYIGNNLIPYEGFRNCTIEDCYRYCSKQKILGIDIETSRKYEKGIYSEEVYLPGLDPYFSRICMFQIGDLTHQFVIDVRVVDISILLPILQDVDVIKIIQNAQFECKHFLHNYNIRIRNIWDTMIVEKLLFNGIPQSYSLKAIAERRLGLKDEELTLFSDSYNSEDEIIDLEEEEEEVDIFGFKKEFIDKSIRNQFVEWGWKPFTLDQIEYGARDVTLPYRIYLMQLQGREINGETWFPYYGAKLENDTTFVLAEMTYRGVPIDSNQWLNTEAENRVIYNNRIAAINRYVEENEYNNPKVCYHADLFNPTPTCKIQWSSPKQVIDLYRSWGICPKEKSKQTGKLEWSVGAKALFKTLPNDLKKDFLNDKFPEVIDTRDLFTLSYLLFKKSEQLITTFGKEWLKYVHPITKRGHPNFNQLMNTTRLSSSNFNVQQLPRTENFRKCISSKEGILLCDDYSSQEVYAGAIVHNSTPLIKFFSEGDATYGTDIHSFMAAKTYSIVYGEDFYCDKKSAERQNQKIITFQTIYGSSEFTLADSIGVEVEKAKEIQDGFKKGFELEESFEIYKKESLESGNVILDPITDKRYFYPYIKEMNDAKQKALSYYPSDYRSYSDEKKKEWKEEAKTLIPDLSYQWKIYMQHKGKLERRSLNFRVQGLCASLTKKAALDFSNYLWENNIQDKVFLIISAHDELLAEILRKEDVIDKEIYGKKLQECMEEASAFFLDGLVSGAEPLYSTFWAK